MKATRYLGGILYRRKVKNLLKWLIGSIMPAGPSREQNKNGFSMMIAEARTGNPSTGSTGSPQAGSGQVATVRAKLKTPEAYYLTALTAVEITKRILDGDFKPGFQTPSKAYGADFILGFDGVTREDLQTNP
jgi:short subunit dehydrogenase-like uncharacterized protein